MQFRAGEGANAVCKRKTEERRRCAPGSRASACPEVRASTVLVRVLLVVLVEGSLQLWLKLSCLGLQTCFPLLSFVQAIVRREPCLGHPVLCGYHQEAVGDTCFSCEYSK